MIYKKSHVAYAMDFASFLVDGSLGEMINKIILFGSVARGDFTKESDIDIFINAPEETEQDIKNQLTLFLSSQVNKLWKQRGITNEISLKVGNLDEWSLKREVISSGILLYGKYNELPKDAKYYMLITLNVTGKKAAQQVRLWRKLYGYKQKIKKKVYSFPGLLVQCGGKKLGKAIVAVPMENRQKIFTLLKENKVPYKLHEFWSDSF